MYTPKGRTKRNYLFFNNLSIINTCSAINDRPVLYLCLHIGHLSALMRHFKQIKWPFIHWITGGGIVSKHIGHSNAANIVCILADSRSRFKGIGPQHNDSGLHVGSIPVVHNNKVTFSDFAFTKLATSTILSPKMSSPLTYMGQ